MAKQVSDFLIERLLEWNITRIFGFPGDGINGILGALDRAKDKMDFIQVRHEENAAFMACGHSKFTGEVGVCLATSGPGAIHLLNGLYDAKMDHQSVVAIVGQSARMSQGGDFQQEVDLNSLYKDVAHEYIHMVSVPMQMRQLVDRAIRIAKAERTVTCIVIPNDIQEMDAEEPPRAHGTIHTGIGFPEVRIIPPESELKRTAELLNDGKKVAMLIGAGALNAAEEVKEVAELLGAGVAKALLGKAALPDDLPYVTGAIGLLGTEPSWKMMMECDTLLMVGSSFPYSEFLPKIGQARGVQIDIDGKMLSLRFPMEINLLGDSKHTLRALIPYLKQNKHHSWRKDIEKDMENWWKVIDARAKDSAKPINPQRVFQELSPRLPDNCILSADSGTSADWFARHLKIREGMKASLSGNLATMCPGVPYSIAAKFAYPDRIPIGMVGDGAMQMLGNNGLITISKYWKRWKDPRLVILVLHNNDLAQVSWEQRVMTGDPKFSGSQDVPDFPYAEYAKLLGLKGVFVNDPEKIGEAWDDVLSADRPAVLEVITDPDVPPLPPHISFEMMVKYSKTLLKGDPDEMKIIKSTWKSEMSTIFH
jgi:pyruvate dehydrogenase (quinone)